MIQQSLRDELAKAGIVKSVVTLVTQLLVDKTDPAFDHPSKPIGPFYTREQRDSWLHERSDLVIEEDSGRGYRRFVPSPDPKSIVEKEAIQVLIRDGTVVIACGGGGIPVVQKDDHLEGVDAVIDKDLAAERLASSIRADTLIVLTDVTGAYLNYGRPEQKLLKKITQEQLETFAKQGFFAKGSMGPKVEAAVRFLKHGGTRSVIASLDELIHAFEGSAGTQVTS